MKNVRELINNLEYVEVLTNDGRKDIQEYVNNLEHKLMSMEENMYIDKISLPISNKTFEEVSKMPTYEELRDISLDLQDSLDKAIGNWLDLSSKIGEMRKNIEDRISIIDTTYLGENEIGYTESIITEMTTRKQTYKSVLFLLDKVIDNE